MSEAMVLDRSGIDQLLSELRDRGYTTVGPTIREETIVYDEISSTADLPVGWTDHQEGGRYELEDRQDDKLFGYVVGPHSWKRFLYPARAVVWAGERGEDGITTLPPEDPAQYAFLGVRPCEMAAIGIQDRVFMGNGGAPDQIYAGRRNGAFFVAVNCVEPGETCFCTSMDTGPRARGGYDIVLTELIRGRTHHFLVETGSEAGEDVLASLGAARRVGEHDVTLADDLLQEAAQQMGRKLDVHGIKELLQRNLNHPQWTDVASRCLMCTNCTLVCPTCFCSTMEDSMDLSGTTAERVRKWDSCFTMDFSYINGGPIRPSRRARYRQWMTHKLANWIDQFGVSGCVGCGRCITWCPVGIDITQEAAAIRASDGLLDASRVPIPEVTS